MMSNWICIVGGILLYNRFISLAVSLVFVTKTVSDCSAHRRLWTPFLGWNSSFHRSLWYSSDVLQPTNTHTLPIFCFSFRTHIKCGPTSLALVVTLSEINDTVTIVSILVMTVNAWGKNKIN